MNASQLIEALHAAIAQHGDHRVFVWAGDDVWVELKAIEQFDHDDIPSHRDDQFRAGDFRL